ncbi:hypothetical protein SLS53_004392 [Cytospora paraplurivora]|uniref:Fork-head domain-containing protein n=1 Tax=Cytospora paraplurivora TaxID=2898453 RepID=A0AAN9U7P8_9PEZI
MAVVDHDSLGDLPAVYPSDGSGVSSPSGNSHLKQPYSPCTTQATSPPTTDYTSGAVTSYHAPTKVSRETVETSAPEALPSSSRSQSVEPDGLQPRDLSPLEALEDKYLQQQQYCPEDLQQRMQGLWSSHTTGPDNYSDCDFKPTDSMPSASGTLVSLPSATQERNELSLRPSVLGLTSPFHNLSDSDHQRLYFTGQVDLCPPANRSQLGDTSYSTAMEDLNRSYQAAGEHYPGNPSSTSSHQYQIGADGLPVMSLSPCSSTLAGAPTGMGREDTVPLSDPVIELDDSMDYNPDLYDAEDVTGSRSSLEPSGGKADEPYAKLIYKAFRSRENRAMSLQEIYQWFRENTDKAKGEGKGWQNSIRHNLSMNGAFIRRETKQAGLNSDGSVSLDASCTDGRISTEWFLNPNYEKGVTSTTRYRKGNNRVAGRSLRGGGRVAAGRKGGYQTAQNRKKVKAKIHHHLAAEAARQQREGGDHLQSHCHMQNLVAPQYYPGSEYFAEYAAQQQQQQQQYQQPPSEQPMSSTTTSPHQAGYGAPGIRGSLMPASEDLYLARSRALQNENDHTSESTTAPGSEIDSPVEDLLLGNKQPQLSLPLPLPLQQPQNQQQQQQQQQHASYVRDVATTSQGVGGLAGYQPVTPAGAGYAQQNYTIADAVAYEPRSGHESPLFTDRFTAEDAAQFAPDYAGWDASGAYFG